MPISLENIERLMIWLADREDDIAEGNEDFTVLRGLFHELFDRQPGEPADTGILY